MSVVTTDQTLLGLGLVSVLGIGSQLVARPLRVPAIVLLLPVGFVAGILTDDVRPANLLGPLYQPFVSIAVGVILFEAGLRLSFAQIQRDVRAVVARLVVVGVVVTWLAVTGATALLFSGLGWGVPLVLGAILVVSGPTVVLPLLAFVRPAGRIRTILTWEGVVVDPIGALLGATVFTVVRAGKGAWHPGAMLLSVSVGLAVGVAAAAALVALLPWVQRTAPRQAVPAVMMVVVAALVGADLLRDDAGFVATTVLGVAIANQRRADVTSAAAFESALVPMLIGVLFILIAASVTPSAVRGVLPEALVLVAVMVFVIRPAAVALATMRMGMPMRERIFAAGVDPRGIVAGATGSAFGISLSQAGVAGADKILPIAFVAILGTVVIYGLGALPLARALGLAGEGGTVVLVVGGSPQAQALATALARAGVRVRVWSGTPESQRVLREAGLTVDRGGMMLGALVREAELEEITDALLLTPDDDFNLMAAATLREELGHGHVFRLAPEETGALAAPDDQADVLGDAKLTAAELGRRLRHGIHEGVGADGSLPLFVVAPGGGLRVVTPAATPQVRKEDTVLSLVSQR
jgi:NhaP-type Na+/H+ or K+/H+ antiporter